MNIAVIFFGPPGSGKGTQAKLLAEKLNLYQYDTGSFLRKVLYDPKFKNNKEVQKRRKEMESGALIDLNWILKVTTRRVQEISALGESIVFSGSPRSALEAFGNKQNSGLMKLLDKKYGRKNIYIFYLDIPQAETVRRNSRRSTCAVCKGQLMAFAVKLKACPFCGGKIEHRKDDRKEAILSRLQEYRKLTLPVLKELKQREYKVIKINGAPAPYKIFEKVLEYF